MAALLEEYDSRFTNLPEIGTRVQAVKNNRFVSTPDVLKDYRRPDHAAIERLK